MSLDRLNGTQTPEQNIPPDTEKTGISRRDALIGSLTLVASATGVGWWLGRPRQETVVPATQEQSPVEPEPKTAPTPEQSAELTVTGFPIFPDVELNYWGVDPGKNLDIATGKYLFSPDAPIEGARVISEFPYRINGEQLTREDIIAKYTLDTERYPTKEEAAAGFIAMLNDYVQAGNSPEDIAQIHEIMTSGKYRFNITSTDGARGDSPVQGWRWPTQREMLVAATTGQGKEGLFSSVPEGIRNEYGTSVTVIDGMGSLEEQLDAISSVVHSCNYPPNFKGAEQFLGQYKPVFKLLSAQETGSDGQGVAIKFTINDNFGEPGIAPANIVDKTKFVNTSREWTLEVGMMKSADGGAWQMFGQAKNKGINIPNTSN